VKKRNETRLKEDHSDHHTVGLLLWTRLCSRQVCHERRSYATTSMQLHVSIRFSCFESESHESRTVSVASQL